MNAEEWRPVVGAEGRYEVSSHGRVRSLDHPVWNGRGYRTVRGQMLKPSPTAHGYLVVAIRRGNTLTQLVHRLVLESFVGPAPDPESQGLHWDDDRNNNHLGNLRWGTHEENMADLSRNHRARGRKKTHCPQGHEYTDDNLYTNEKGSSYWCKTCRQTRDRNRKRAS